MSDLQRFDLKRDHIADCYCEIEADKNGDYVLAEAALRLQAHIKKLEYVLSKTTSDLDKMLDEKDKTIGKLQARIEELEAERDRYKAEKAERDRYIEELIKELEASQNE